jgi:mRNA interferase RelE/StbE
MELEFRESFIKDIDKIQDKKAKKACFDIIDQLPNLNTLREIPNIKKLKGFKSYYRIKIGDYRVGIEYKDSKLIFKRFLLRKDVYKYFP